jgi:hypothetical protein
MIGFLWKGPRRDSSANRIGRKILIAINPTAETIRKTPAHTPDTLPGELVGNATTAMTPATQKLRSEIIRHRNPAGRLQSSASMPLPSDIARIKAEIAKLEADHKASTDSQIQEVIQRRIEELRRKLAKLHSSGRERQ